MSDRIAVMKGGHVLQLGTPTDIYNTPQHRDVAAFVGAPRINFLSIEHDSLGRPSLQGQSLEGRFPAGVAELAFRPHVASGSWSVGERHKPGIPWGQHQAHAASQPARMPCPCVSTNFVCGRKPR